MCSIKSFLQTYLTENIVNLTFMYWKNRNKNRIIARYLILFPKMFDITLWNIIMQKINDIALLQNNNEIH